jgi:hypothetical protein
LEKRRWRVAARVEEMAAAKKLENGEGAAAALGEERRGKRVTAKGGKGGGGCRQGALREGAARVLGGEVGFPPPDRDQT